MIVPEQFLGHPDRRYSHGQISISDRTGEHDQ